MLYLIVGCSIKGEEIETTQVTSVQPVATPTPTILPPPFSPDPLPTPEQKKPYEYDASLSLKQKEEIVEQCNNYVSYLNSFYWDAYKDEVILETEEVIELYLEDINQKNILQLPEYGAGRPKKWDILSRQLLESLVT